MGEIRDDSRDCDLVAESQSTNGDVIEDLREVEYRDAEATRLTEILAPFTDGNPADTILRLGPSGVDNTSLTKYTAEQLHQEILGVEYQYVNRWLNFFEYQTIYRILEGLGKTLDIHRQSTPRDELFERLR